ncbi:MAG: HAD family hydrolase, partial [Gammaproteobacteria bacterium]|nr:HAD family hydrolase [Gammaproteobacteria bacterium]
GLTSLFNAIIDGNNVVNGKPHPEVFLRGAAALGLNPVECLVFEDGQAGVDAASAAGMDSVFVDSRSLSA